MNADLKLGRESGAEDMQSPAKRDWREYLRGLELREASGLRRVYRRSGIVKVVEPGSYL